MQNRLLFGFLSVYGLLIACAMGLGVLWCLKEEKRLGLPREISVDFALWVLPSAVIGARLYYVIFQWPLYAPNPLRILYIWEGGLAIYGGVIGGAVAALLFSRKKRVPFAVLADLVAPALILGQAIGRWGNYFNGEAYGEIITNPALQFFPVAVFADGNWHMATFFYESVWDFCGFLFLFFLRKRITARGNLFFLYMLWYGVGRTFIEGLRTDSLMLGSIRVSQALSVVMVVVSAAVLILRHRRHKGETPYPIQ